MVNLGAPAIPRCWGEGWIEAMVSRAPTCLASSFVAALPFVDKEAVPDEVGKARCRGISFLHMWPDPDCFILNPKPLSEA